MTRAEKEERCVGDLVGMKMKRHYQRQPTSTLLVMLVMMVAALPPTTIASATSSLHHQERPPNPKPTNSTPAQEGNDTTMIMPEDLWELGVDAGEGENGNITISWPEPWRSDWNLSSYNVTVNCSPLHPSCGCLTCQSHSDSTDKPFYTFQRHPATSYSIVVVGKVEDGNSSSVESLEKVFNTSAEAPSSSSVSVNASSTALAFSWGYACPYTGPVTHIFTLAHQQLEILETGACQYQARAEGLQPYTNFAFSLLTATPDCPQTKPCDPQARQARDRADNGKEGEGRDTNRDQESTRDMNGGVTERIGGRDKNRDQESTRDMNGGVTERIGGRDKNGDQESTRDMNEGIDYDLDKERPVEENKNYDENGTVPHALPSCKKQMCEVTEEEGSMEEGEACSVCYTGTTQTLPDVPSAPRNLEAVPPNYQNASRASSQCHVSWIPPARQNGKLHHYLLTYSKDDYPTWLSENYPSSFLSEYDLVDRTAVEVRVYGHGQPSACPKGKHGGPDLVCHLLEDIKPETKYKLSVVAFNKEPAGQPSNQINFTLETGAGVPFYTRMPLRQPGEVKAAHAHILDIDTSAFSHRNGRIRRYEVWIKKTRSKMPAFLVFCSSSLENRSICLGRTKPPVDPACLTTTNNEPLESGTLYTCFLKIFTNAGEAQSTAIFFETAVSYLVMLVSLVVAVVVLVLVVLATYAIYTNSCYYYTMKRSESLNLPLEVLPPPDLNVERRILLTQLLSTVTSLQAYGMIGLRREYAELKSASPTKPCTQAKLSVNTSKNRYTNIIPFDDTRVILKEYRRIPNTDYINASYIHGFSTPREFIACQGPMELNVDDFWRMVWEKGVHVLVMLTQCVEKNMLKCSQYWPDLSNTAGQRLHLSGLTITTLQERQEQDGGYILRHIQISKGYRTRTVHHFHFMGWPDMGCPQTPDALIAFISTVKATAPPENRHIVVHCSAGVGRTGTFIGLSNLMEAMRDQASVDVFHTVYKMRHHRMNMVQTEAQYSFLYKCVLKYHLDQTGQSEAWTGTERRRVPDLLSGTTDATHYPQTEHCDEPSDNELFSEDEDGLIKETG